MVTTKLIVMGTEATALSDGSRSLHVELRELLSHVSSKFDAASGTSPVGIMMRHLVGVVLEICHDGLAIVDCPVDTSLDSCAELADFRIGDVAIHVTNNPSELLVRKCRKNLDIGLRPIVITSKRGAVAIDHLAEIQGISDRIDVFEFEQFIALNIYELGKFKVAGNQVAIGEIIARYNEIVKMCETDPSLAIES